MAMKLVHVTAYVAGEVLPRAKTYHNKSVRKVIQYAMEDFPEWTIMEVTLHRAHRIPGTCDAPVTQQQQEQRTESHDSSAGDPVPRNSIPPDKWSGIPPHAQRKNPRRRRGAAGQE